MAVFERELVQIGLNFGQKSGLCLQYFGGKIKYCVLQQIE